VELSSTGAGDGRGASAARPGGWVPVSVPVAKKPATCKNNDQQVGRE